MKKKTNTKLVVISIIAVLLLISNIGIYMYFNSKAQTTGNEDLETFKETFTEYFAKSEIYYDNINNLDTAFNDYYYYEDEDYNGNKLYVDRYEGKYNIFKEQVDSFKVFLTENNEVLEAGGVDVDREINLLSTTIDDYKNLLDEMNDYLDTL